MARRHASLARLRVLPGLFSVPSIGESAARVRDVSSTVLLTVNSLLGIVGVVALTVLIYGIYRFFASRGDARGTQTTRRLIWWSVVGVLGASLLASLANGLLGILGSSSPPGDSAHPPIV